MKTLFLSLLTGLTIGSAIARVDISSPYDENQAEILSNIGHYGAILQDKDLLHSDFIGIFDLLIANFIRLQSMRIAPGHVHEREYCETFASPYINPMHSLPASQFLLSDITKRTKYAAVVNQILYCLMNWQPFLSDPIYKQVVNEFESQLTAFIKENSDTTIDASDNAHMIVEKLSTLTIAYYQEMLTPEQKDMLLSIEKENDTSFVEGIASILTKTLEEMT